MTPIELDMCYCNIKYLLEQTCCIGCSKCKFNNPISGCFKAELRLIFNFSASLDSKCLLTQEDIEETFSMVWDNVKERCEISGSNCDTCIFLDKSMRLCRRISCRNKIKNAYEKQGK